MARRSASVLATARPGPSAASSPFARAAADRQEGERAARRVALFGELAEKFPKVPAYHLDLGNGLNTLVQFRPADAEDASRRSVALFKGLVAENADQPAYRKMLAVADNTLAGLLRDAGRPADADAALADAGREFEALIARAPTEVDLKRYLGQTLADRADLCLARKDAAAARPFLERAIALQREALKPNDKDPDVRLALHEHLGRLAAAALDLGDYDGAARLAAELALFAPDATEGRLDAARLLARCATSVGADAKLPADRRKALADAYAARAVGFLRAPRAPGSTLLAHLETDADLAPLRSRDDFKQLVSFLHDRSR